jgi:hypothetical protein
MSYPVDKTQYYVEMVRNGRILWYCLHDDNLEPMDLIVILIGM